MLLGNFCLVGPDGHDGDVDLDGMIAAAVHHPFERAHVVEVPSPTDGQVVGFDIGVVRRVQIDPAVSRHENGKPCVRRVAAD